MTDGRSELLRETKLFKKVPVLGQSFLDFHVNELNRLFFKCVEVAAETEPPLVSISVYLDNDPEKYGWFLPDNSRHFAIIYFRRRVYFLLRMDTKSPMIVPPRPARGLLDEWGVGLVRWDTKEQKAKLMELQRDGSPSNTLSWIKAQLLPASEADWTRSVILPRRAEVETDVNRTISSAADDRDTHRDNRDDDDEEVDHMVLDD
jgi:hypothetical protein